jgi:hypothetical protein
MMKLVVAFLICFTKVSIYKFFITLSLLGNSLIQQFGITLNSEDNTFSYGFVFVYKFVNKRNI